MRIIEEDGLINLYADDGKVLFNNEGIESEHVVLGIYDRSENWQEKDKEEEVIE